jgi:acyl-CoA synthetase (AMP-forming)/AMP-acid ligase II
VDEGLDLSAMLRHWAREQPDHPALIEPAARRSGWRQMTFGQFDARIDQHAHALARKGVRPADRVLFFLRPSGEAMAALIALTRIRAVPVGIDPGMGLRAMLRCIAQICPRVVLAVPQVHLLRLVARRAFSSAELFITPGRRGYWGERLPPDTADTAVPFPASPAGADDEAYVVFTSGSTGPALPVSITHAMIANRVPLAREVCGWRDGMKVVVCFPSQAPTVLANGLTAILPDMDFSRPASAEPARIVAAIAEHGAEAAFASPAVWRNIVAHCNARDLRLPTLTQAVTAGAPMTRKLHNGMLSVLAPGGRVRAPYGATEALPVTGIDSTGLEATWPQTRQGLGNCVGAPVAGVRVSVIRRSDVPIAHWRDNLCVAEGEVGELVFNGPVVSRRYCDLPIADARTKILRDGEVWHRMGDLGRIDAAGRVWFCGRKSDRITTLAGILDPVPLESVLNEHPRVRRTAIVGVGPPQARVATACVEMEPSLALTASVLSELIGLMRGTHGEGRIDRFLQHPGFPTDTRHNAKLKRSEIARWAARRYGIGD